MRSAGAVMSGHARSGRGARHGRMPGERGRKDVDAQAAAERGDHGLLRDHEGQVRHATGGVAAPALPPRVVRQPAAAGDRAGFAYGPTAAASGADGARWAMAGRVSRPVPSQRAGGDCEAARRGTTLRTRHGDRRQPAAGTLIVRGQRETDRLDAEWRASGRLDPAVASQRRTASVNWNDALHRV